ncbi:MAG: hypothetical protein FJZ47_20560 [Candidatus Tectomicrobia bacterium]|uniref:Type II/III secretion system secretin-like domain-containing protein n=1 Tax=Tectimicrobiota bacterium TaxID=2528274 RepID=A0A937W6Y9_UNCTE|nr:hypothetical protein [Candidatus Tectomicrobia bacterium]
MNALWRKLRCFAAIGLMVTGCGTLGTVPLPWSGNAAASQSTVAPIRSASDAKAALESGLTPSQILIRSGVDLLLKGDLDEAQAVFSTALKFDFNNAHLHFLNALAYHQGYLRGAADNLSLAKTGYHTALLQDPSLEGLAYLQLGRLFLDAKHYGPAKQAFAMAVDANRQSADALYGLAQAAALEGDLRTSYWATSELDRVNWGNPLLYRLKAIHAALAQQPERARALAADYAKASSDRADAHYLLVRIDQLLTFETASRASGSPPSSGSGSGPVLLAQSPSPFGDMPPPAAQPEGAPAPEARLEGTPAPAAPPEVSKWFRCDTEPGLPSQSVVNPGASGATDETITTAPLPAPCPGELPKTAIIEVTMVQTAETKSKNLGINLFEGLSAISTLQMERTYTRSTDVTEEVRTTNLVIANAVENSTDILRYSLNIANAAYTRSEVLARPVLAAIDRVPAVFFSGATITLGIAGTGGGASTVVDKPVGVSLTVTPTFIDDETVLVSMRATRSTLETNLVSPSTSIILQQTRDTITASAKLKFEETFVVSGLATQRHARTESGVPLLQHIPILQYLFKRLQNIDTTQQILTMITLRRPPASEAEAAKAKTKPEVSTHKLSGAVNAFVELQSIPPVIDTVLARLRATNPQYRQLREKDLIQEKAGSKSKLQSILDDFKQSIYY